MPGLRPVLLFYEELWPLDPVTYVHRLNRQWGEWARLSGKPWIAAEVGSSFTPLEHTRSALILGSRNLMDCFQQAFAFYNARNPHTQYALEVEPHRVRAVIQYPPGLEPVRQDAEKRLSLLANTMRWFTHVHGDEVMPEFRTPAPHHRDQLAKVFRAPLRFDAAIDSLVIDPRVMSAPIWGSDQVASKLGQLYLEDLIMHAVPRTCGGRVRVAIRMLLARGQGGIKSVAAEFGVTPRTLQRHLGEESTSFRRELDETRQRLCAEWIQDGTLPVDEISRRLGYSNPSNFARAFRQWFGKSPRRLRRDLFIHPAREGAAN